MDEKTKDEKEIERERDAGLRRLLNTPPKEHTEEEVERDRSYTGKNPKGKRRK